MSRRHSKRIACALGCAVLILSPRMAFAQVVYTWGYGDILAQALRAVKWMLATNDFYGMFKLFVTVSLIYALFAVIWSNMKQTDPFLVIKLYFVQSLIFSLFMSARMDVAIDDRQNPAFNQVVTDVPWGIAKPLSVFSLFQKVTADVMETTFSMPDDLKYSNSGYFSGIGLLSQAGQHKIIDPYLYMSVNAYIINCVLPDLADGTKNEADLLSSEALWEDFGNTNPARTTLVYEESNKRGAITNCLDAYNQITGRLSLYIENTALPYIGSTLGGYSSFVVANVLGTASPFFLNYSVTGQGFLMQSIAINHMSEAWALANGAAPEVLGFGAGKAEETARQNMMISAVLGSRYVPVIKGILTVILASVTPFLVLLLVTPLFSTTILGFLATLFTLSLWHVGDIILNLIINVKASGYLRVAAGSSYTRLSKELVDPSLLDYVNMAGSMYWIIPSIPLAIMGFAAYKFHSLAGSLAAAPSGAASVTSRETGAASASFGNVQYDTASANSRSYTRSLSSGMAATYLNTTSWNESDFSTRSQSGMFDASVSGAAVGAASSAGEQYAGMFQRAFNGGVSVIGQKHHISDETASYERGTRFMTEMGPLTATGSVLTKRGPEGEERIEAGSFEGFMDGKQSSFVISAGRMVEASVSDGTRSEVYGGGKRTVSGVTDARSAESLGREAAEAGMNNVAAAVAPGMEYQYTYGSDGRLVSAELKQGGQLLVRDEAESRVGTSGKEIVNREFSLGGMTFLPGTAVTTHGAGTNRRTEVEGITADGRSVHGVYSGNQWAWADVKRGQEATLAVGREELLTRAEALERSGHPQAASGMREIAASLGSGENARIGEFRGANGEWASSRVDHGGKTEWVDHSGRLMGRRSHEEDMKTREKGNRERIEVGPQQLGGLANTLEAQGMAPETVARMRELAGQGHSAQVEIARPLEGGAPSRLSVFSGGEAVVKDFAMTQSGRRNTFEDVDTSTVNYGIEIGSSMQMALDRNPKIAQFVSDYIQAEFDPNTFNANVAATAKYLANDMGGFLRKSGVSLDYAEGSIGFKWMGTGAIGGMRSNKDESVNLLASEYDQLIRQSVTEARERGLDRVNTEKYVAKKVGDFTQNIYDQAREATSKEFGVNAPMKTIEQFLNKNFDPGKVDLDELKNRPD